MQVFTKTGCTGCDDVKRILNNAGATYSEEPCVSLADMHARAFRIIGHSALDQLTFPVVVDTSTGKIMSEAKLRDSFDEPLLRPSLDRFSAFPVVYNDMWKMYKTAVSSFWTADEISLSKDVDDWEKLEENERRFLKHILAFFASSDGIIIENLAANFCQEVQVPEARQFYAYQMFSESVHNETYGILIDSLIRDPTERHHLFSAITSVPGVKLKAEWALKWLDNSRRFAERLVAFVCVEGILFAGSFCALFWLKQHRAGMMPGLSLSNQFIARDENMHQRFGTLLYRHLKHSLTQREVEAIVGEAVENEKLFITEAVPCSLVGMNSALMSQYIEYIADRLLVELGHARMYNTSNPFLWMEAMALYGKTNFFEATVSEYARADVIDKERVFAIDDVF